MHILVTGSNGQLGKEIKKRANPTQHHWHFHDIDSLDITDTNELVDFFEKNKIDLIVNCAAYTAVDKAEEDEKTANIINHIAVRDLSLLAKENQCKLIHISTDYVFDGKHYKPYEEDDSPKPQSVYGFTKLKGEYDVLNNKESIIIRTAWLYSSEGNNFVKTIRRLATEREELNVIFDQIGNPTYAGDLAEAILSIINLTDSSDDKFVPGIYHFANEGACSWYDFALEIIEQSKLQCKVFPIPTKEYQQAAPRPHYSVLDKSKIKSTFQIAIPHWKKSLIKCLEEMKA